MTWLTRLLAEEPGLGDLDRPPVGGLVVQGAQCAPAPFDPTLETLCAGLPPEEAQALREERAGILEFEAGMTRAEAERKTRERRTHAQEQP
ncbi:MAG: hypothetical protein ABSH53_21345 [Holophaga sp.]|jgi:hypothetical protein